LLIWLSSLVQKLRRKAFSQRADVHTHDDNCYTCGHEDIFGTQPAWGPKDPKQYECRHRT
jgi:hypothetical protein